MGLRGPPPDLERLAKIKKLRGLGMTYAEIAIKLGVSRQRVQAIVEPAARQRAYRKYQKKQRHVK